MNSHDNLVQIPTDNIFFYIIWPKKSVFVESVLSDCCVVHIPIECNMLEDQILLTEIFVLILFWIKRDLREKFRMVRIGSCCFIVSHGYENHEITESIMTDSNDYHPETTKGSLWERGVIRTWMADSYYRSVKSYCLHDGKNLRYNRQHLSQFVCETPPGEFWDKFQNT